MVLGRLVVGPEAMRPTIWVFAEGRGAIGAEDTTPLALDSGVMIFPSWRHRAI